MSTLARQPDKPVGAVGETGANGDGQGGQAMAQAARRASMGQQEPFHQEYQRQQPSIQQQEQYQQQQQAQQQQQSQLQAQRMYPNHPLLNSTSPHVPLQQWVPTSAAMTNMYGSPIDTYSNTILSAPPAGGFDLGRSGSMRMSSSDMGASSSSMGRMESGSSVGSYDYGYKKKACDQCNHSKVKCDFTYPCGKSFAFQHTHTNKQTDVHFGTSAAHTTRSPSRGQLQSPPSRGTLVCPPPMDPPLEQHTTACPLVLARPNRLYPISPRRPT